LNVLNDEFEIVLDKHHVGGKPGALAFVPSGAVHRLRCGANYIGRVLLIYTPGGIEGFFREAGLPLVGDGGAPMVDSAEIARTEKARSKIWAASG
jgi:hypothetical protein